MAREDNILRMNGALDNWSADSDESTTENLENVCLTIFFFILKNTPAIFDHVGEAKG